MNLAVISKSGVRVLQCDVPGFVVPPTIEAARQEAEEKGTYFDPDWRPGDGLLLVEGGQRQ